jgi:TPR repeat protein
MHMLALMYLRGNGVEKDIDRGHDLLERAAASGHIFSKRNLASLLIRGDYGISKVPRGLLLFMSALKDALTVVPTDPHSDRLR